MRCVEKMPDHFRRLSVFSSLHSFWTDMTGTASQADRQSKLHFDPDVFSVTIGDNRQHAVGQNVPGPLFPREPA